MTEEEAPGLSWSYLAKVVGAVALMASVAAFGVVPDWPGLSNAARMAMLALGALVCVAAAPLAARAYRRRDEFHRFIHQSACVSTLPVLVAVHGVIGALQAANVLPAFNQLLSMLLVLGVWGVQLMLADRQSR